MDTGSPDGRIMNADANYSAGFKKMDEAGLTEKVAEQADMNYAFPAKSMEMMRSAMRSCVPFISPKSPGRSGI